jgi:hypothetical protein
VDGVYTNKPPGGVAYRCSFRVTEAVHAIERASFFPPWPDEAYRNELQDLERRALHDVCVGDAAEERLWKIGRDHVVPDRVRCEQHRCAVTNDERALGFRDRRLGEAAPGRSDVWRMSLGGVSHGRHHCMAHAVATAPGFFPLDKRRRTIL